MPTQKGLAPEHWPLAQQSPCLQAPPQQTLPAPHCALLVHTRQSPLTHASEPAQSLLLQHEAPAWHTLLQQRPLGQSPSSTQLRQVLLAHTPSPPEQSSDLQQSPASQRPAQHFFPWPQLASVAQTTHLLSTQMSLPHSALAQQLPCLHEPPQHRAPAPHSSSPVQARHAPRMQAVPAPQSL